MKKLLCLMLQLLVLLPLAAVLLPQAMSAEESGEDVVEFVLHKRMIRDIDYNDQFEYHENDGLAISEEAGGNSRYHFTDGATKWSDICHLRHDRLLS